MKNCENENEHTNFVRPGHIIHTHTLTVNMTISTLYMMANSIIQMDIYQ